MEKMECRNGRVSHNGKHENGKNGIWEWKKWNAGMEEFRTMENMKIENGTIPKIGQNGNGEWNGPEQWKEWDTGTERALTMEDLDNIG